MHGMGVPFTIRSIDHDGLSILIGDGEMLSIHVTHPEFANLDVAISKQNPPWQGQASRAPCDLEMWATGFFGLFQQLRPG